jgi:hypothetical protein
MSVFLILYLTNIVRNACKDRKTVKLIIIYELILKILFLNLSLQLPFFINQKLN